jgi:prolyl-tRNA editing enzyme YbaK/EbsC (Cys-tRNA(Pro) deacylase)
MLPIKLGVNELQVYMQVHNIPGEIIHLDIPTPTVESAAKAVGVQPDQIIKSILFVVDAQPILAIASGFSKINRRAIADLFEVGRKRVKLASPQMVLEISGYEIGAMPPFGHRQKLKTLLDHRVLDFSEAYAGGGAENVLIHLNPKDLQQATGGTVLDLIEKPENG